jgi:AraC-like DNA-binding protein
MERAMDALSEALSSVRMIGAIFFDAICTVPWGFSVPSMEQGAPILAPGTDRLVGYHLVAEGKAVVGLDSVGEIPVTSGDIVIFPHGHPHTISNGAPRMLVDSAKAIEGFLAGDVSTFRTGGGEETRFVCDYFGCERHAARLFLSGLPSVVTMNVRHDGAGRWLESSIRHLLCEAASVRPGRAVLLAKMAEALFIETVRRFMDEMPSGQTGWLAAARDPVVGLALAWLHRKPCLAWSLAELAAACGTSRSVLAERFTRLVGEPLRTYLHRWRLQLAARKLQMCRDTVLQIALDVGYESEAAFCRAFKREVGMSPMQYRRQRSQVRQGNSAGEQIADDGSTRRRSSHYVFQAE